jgi:hypothetical protein
LSLIRRIRRLKFDSTFGSARLAATSTSVFKSHSQAHSNKFEEKVMAPLADADSLESVVRGRGSSGQDPGLMLPAFFGYLLTVYCTLQGTVPSRVS